MHKFKKRNCTICAVTTLKKRLQYS